VGKSGEKCQKTPVRLGKPQIPILKRVVEDTREKTLETSPKVLSTNPLLCVCPGPRGLRGDPIPHIFLDLLGVSRNSEENSQPILEDSQQRRPENSFHYPTLA